MNKEEVKKLAELARIEVTDEEAERFGVEMENILNYVQDVKKVSSDNGGIIETAFVNNVMRQDEDGDNKGEYKDKLIKNAPNNESGYIKTKKILSNQDELN